MGAYHDGPCQAGIALLQYAERVALQVASEVDIGLHLRKQEWARLDMVGAPPSKQTAEGWGLRRVRGACRCCRVPVGRCSSACCLTRQ